MDIPPKIESPQDLEAKSLEIQEILSVPPKGLIKWGISVIFIALLMVFIGSYFIRYPEVIPARLTLTSFTPPTSIVARSMGRLALLVHDGQEVDEDTHLGIIESSANSSDILLLLKNFRQFKMESFGNLNRESITFPENINAGELQSVYISFLKSLKEYDLFKALDYYEKQMLVLQDQIHYNVELNAQLLRQIELAEEELFLSKKKLKVDSTLLFQKVITELDFDKTRILYLSSKKNYELAYQNVTNNKIRRSELESRIGELRLAREEKISTFKNNISGSLKQLESGLHDWEQRYLLKAPVKGKVAFFKNISDNQFVNAGEEIMKVMPDSTRMFGEVLMPIAGSGKVEVGQRVNIKLDNYPYQEYGLLIGRIETISSVPKENMYSIHVKLPKGLRTTYKKDLPFRQEMQGNAEIITKNLRLTDRIMNQFRSLIDKTDLSEEPL